MCYNAIVLHVTPVTNGRETVTVLCSSVEVWRFPHGFTCKIFRSLFLRYAIDVRPRELWFMTTTNDIAPPTLPPTFHTIHVTLNVINTNDLVTRLEIVMRIRVQFSPKNYSGTVCNRFEIVHKLLLVHTRSRTSTSEQHCKMAV